jgi:hypothetical protein
MNIIAELKPPHRTEIRSMLSDYGFLCMKYVEAYDMVLPSDRRVIMDNGRMAIDQSILGESRTSIAYYGIRCDESHPASDHLTGTEVTFHSKLVFNICLQLSSFAQILHQDHWFVREDLANCFWGDRCEGFL